MLVPRITNLQTTRALSLAIGCPVDLVLMKINKQAAHRKVLNKLLFGTHTHTWHQMRDFRFVKRGRYGQADGRAASYEWKMASRLTIFT